MPKTYVQARFSARAESYSDSPARLLGLNPFSMYRQFDFKWICFRSRAKISARLTGLKFSTESGSKCGCESTWTYVDTNPNNYMRIEFVV